MLLIISGLWIAVLIQLCIPKGYSLIMELFVNVVLAIFCIYTVYKYHILPSELLLLLLSFEVVNTILRVYKAAVIKGRK